jgi:type II secretory ATPase GspE/PulE/Tfp pilus assembly ATPase PilB-like protein
MHRITPAHYTPSAPESPEAILAGTLTLALVREALARGARRVHLQPTADHRLEVRMRTPHGLRPGPWPFIEAKVAPFVVARLKDAADLNAEERCVPQEGRMTIQRVPERPVALRVNTLPTRHGEAVLIEVLEPEGALTLDALGLDPWCFGARAAHPHRQDQTGVTST